MSLMSLLSLVLCISIVVGFKNCVQKTSKQNHNDLQSTKNKPLSAKQHSTQQYDWSFLDDVYLITTKTAAPGDISNLQRSNSPTTNNRLNKVLSELSKVNLSDSKLTVKSFEADSTDKVRGCYTSHIATLQEIASKNILKRNYQVLVVEDNLEVTSRVTPAVLKGVQIFFWQ